MEIEIIKSSVKFSEEHDYRDFLVIKINERTIFNFLEGEPEDANLSRDFHDAYKIKLALKTAYEAGKKGENLILTERKSDDFIYNSDDKILKKDDE